MRSQVKLRFAKIMPPLVGLSVVTSLSWGQITVGESGVPGDGIPDIYYFATATTIETSLGPMTRDAGYVVLDTEKTTEFLGLVVSDVNSYFLDGCILCGNDIIPDPPHPGHVYNVGSFDQGTVWKKAFPLDGSGPTGVFDLAQGPGGLPDTYFDQRYQPPAGGSFWSAWYIPSGNGLVGFYTNVTVVPEPHLWIGLLPVAMLWWRSVQGASKSRPGSSK